MSQQTCQICKQDIHSITTVPFGSYFICRDCNMLLGPLLESIANGIVERSAFLKGFNTREIVIREIETNFMGLISKPNSILEILR